ncbi:probable demethylmenaquinone methyltransferase at N-terminal half [Coccomyxa sp. Obi]|nr:probable demethylmenaquinone methyltransferase at N-terminal half [Coccomyxa sp. Obi]
MKKDAKAELLAKSWTVVATNYDKQLAPLFQPWIDQLLALFTAQRLPPGPIVAPACGPGGELLLLAEQLPADRRIVGVDLAKGMIDIASKRLSGASLSDRVSARVGDACQVPQDLHPVAGIFSCFGLQQMPEPKQVLGNWISALAPGGVLAVCYWPPADGQRDAAWRALTDPSLFKPAATIERGWDADLASAAVAAGADVLEDASPPHAMHFESPSHCFDVMMEAGPLHSRLLHLGAAHMEDLKGRYVSNFPKLAPGSAFVIRPNARMMLLRKCAPVRAAL